MSQQYDEVYARSIVDREGFWADAAADVHWYRRWERVLDRSRDPLTRWFVGGVTNTCYNALDAHIERGRGEQTALIYDSPLAGTVRKFSYRQLRDDTARFAGALAALGVIKGDRVIIYMPMVPEAVVAMLACARIGAVHSVVFGGFAAPELAKRIADAKPKVIVSASCGLEPGRTVAYKPLLDEAIEISPSKPQRCVILQRPQLAAVLNPPRDLDWDEAIRDAKPAACVPVEATDPLYILYTSGTTGLPKGVIRDNGGHLVALKWSMKYIYGVEPGEVYWAASDIGWVVGHSYIVYAPLFHGCTTILIRGKTGRYAGSGRVLAGDLAASRFRSLHRADGVPRHQARRSERRLHEEVRSQPLPVPLPGRRALRSRHPAVGPGQTRRAGHRPLVADRDRVADRRELRRTRHGSDQTGIVHQGGPRL
jgi:propionyl-CoA synthetase